MTAPETREWTVPLFPPGDGYYGVATCTSDTEGSNPTVTLQLDGPRGGLHFIITLTPASARALARILRAAGQEEGVHDD